MSPEIAATRGVRVGEDCISPSRHAEFSDTDSLLDWVEMLAAETGLPVGIKSAVGDLTFWDELTDLMAGTDRGVDFVTVDGGEGGTGAAPLIFTDSVSLPFQVGFARVYRMFAEAGSRTSRSRSSAAASSACPTTPSSPSRSAATWSTSPARRCSRSAASRPSGATPTPAPPASRPRTPWLTRGLDPSLKSVRAANYIKTLRRDLMKVAEACGVEHPGLIGTDAVEILDGRTASTPLREVYEYEPGMGYAVGGRPGPHRAPDDGDCTTGSVRPALGDRDWLTARGQHMTEPYDHLLERYARLVIRVGVNVQPGQEVVINGLPEQADVARAARPRGVPGGRQPGHHQLRGPAPSRVRRPARARGDAGDDAPAPARGDHGHGGRAVRP